MITCYLGFVVVSFKFGFINSDTQNRVIAVSTLIFSPKLSSLSHLLFPLFYRAFVRRPWNRMCLLCRPQRIHRENKTVLERGLASQEPYIEIQIFKNRHHGPYDWSMIKHSLFHSYQAKVMVFLRSLEYFSSVLVIFWEKLGYFCEIYWHHLTPE